MGVVVWGSCCRRFFRGGHGVIVRFALSSPLYTWTQFPVVTGVMFPCILRSVGLLPAFSAGLAVSAGRFPCILRSVGWLGWLGWGASLHYASGLAGSAGRFSCILRSVGWLGGLGWTASLHCPPGRLARLARLSGFPAFSTGSAGLAGLAGRLPCILRSVGWLRWAASLHYPLGRPAWLALLDGFPAFSARSLPWLARLDGFRAFPARSAGLAGRLPSITLVLDWAQMKCSQRILFYISQSNIRWELPPLLVSPCPSLSYNFGQNRFYLCFCPKPMHFPKTPPK